MAITIAMATIAITVVLAIFSAAFLVALLFIIHMKGE